MQVAKEEEEGRRKVPKKEERTKKKKKKAKGKVKPKVLGRDLPFSTALLSLSLIHQRIELRCKTLCSGRPGRSSAGGSRRKERGKEHIRPHMNGKMRTSCRRRSSFAAGYWATRVTGKFGQQRANTIQLGHFLQPLQRGLGSEDGARLKVGPCRPSSPSSRL